MRSSDFPHSNRMAPLTLLILNLIAFSYHAYAEYVFNTLLNQSSIDLHTVELNGDSISLTFVASPDTPRPDHLDLVIVPALLPKIKSFERVALLMKQMKTLKTGGWASYLPKSGKCLLRATFWEMHVWSQTPLCPRKRSLWTRFLNWISNKMPRFSSKKVIRPAWKMRKIDTIVPKEEWVPTISRTNCGLVKRENICFDVNINRTHFKIHPKDDYHTEFRALLISRWRRRIFAINTQYLSRPRSDQEKSIQNGDRNQALKIFQSISRTTFEFPLSADLVALFRGKKITTSKINRNNGVVEICYSNQTVVNGFNHSGKITFSALSTDQGILMGLRHQIFSTEDQKIRRRHDDGYRANFFESVFAADFFNQAVKVHFKETSLRLEFTKNSPKMYEKLLELLESDKLAKWFDLTNFDGIENRIFLSPILDHENLSDEEKSNLLKELKLDQNIAKIPPEIRNQLDSLGVSGMIFRHSDNFFISDSDSGDVETPANVNNELSKLSSYLDDMDKLERFALLTHVVENNKIAEKLKNAFVKYLLVLLKREEDGHLLDFVQENNIMGRVAKTKAALLPYIAYFDELNFFNYTTLKNIHLSLTGTDSDGLSVFHYAAQGSAFDTLEFLITKDKNHACITKKDKKKRSPLHYSTSKSNKPITELLLQSGLSSNDPDIFGVTPLTIAVIRNDTATVELMLELQTPTEKSNLYSLSYAAKLMRNNKMAELFIRHNVFPPHVALKLACQYAHTSYVAFILDNFGDDLQKSVVDGFKIAVRNGHKSIVELILKYRKFDPGSVGYDAVKSAFLNGDAEMISVLMKDPRINLEAEEFNGDLVIASKKGNFKLVEASLSSKYQLSTKGKDVDIAFGLAHRYHRHSIAEILLKTKLVSSAIQTYYAKFKELSPSKASENASKRAKKAQDHSKALQKESELLLRPLYFDWICRYGGLRKIRELVRQGHCDVSDKLFIDLCRIGDDRVVKMLVEGRKIDVKAEDNAAIVIASEEGHVNVVEILLAQKAVNAGARNNEAIIKASENGHLNVVELLIKDPKVNPAARKNAALKAAYAKNHDNVVEFLLCDKRVSASVNTNDFSK